VKIATMLLSGAALSVASPTVAAIGSATRRMPVIWAGAGLGVLALILIIAGFDALETS
jgi:hypothetical protein